MNEQWLDLMREWGWLSGPVTLATWWLLRGIAAATKPAEPAPPPPPLTRETMSELCRAVSDALDQPGWQPYNNGVMKLTRGGMVVREDGSSVEITSHQSHTHDVRTNFSGREQEHLAAKAAAVLNAWRLAALKKGEWVS